MHTIFPDSYVDPLSNIWESFEEIMAKNIPKSWYQCKFTILFLIQPYDNTIFFITWELMWSKTALFTTRHTTKFTSIHFLYHMHQTISTATIKKQSFFERNDVPFVANFLQTDMNDKKLNNFIQSAATCNANR